MTQSLHNQELLKKREELRISGKKEKKHLSALSNGKKIESKSRLLIMYRSKSNLLGHIILGMNESILHRMTNSAYENETFINYFQLYIKIQTEHA